MNTRLITTRPTTTSRRRRRIGAAIAVAVGTVGIGGTAGAQVVDGPSEPPAWTVCEYRHVPAAVDLGPLLPVTHDPPEPVKRILLGEIDVGTDCSIYDLPI